MPYACCSHACHSVRVSALVSGHALAHNFVRSHFDPAPPPCALCPHWNRACIISSLMLACAVCPCLLDRPIPGLFFHPPCSPIAVVSALPPTFHAAPHSFPQLSSHANIINTSMCGDCAIISSLQKNKSAGRRGRMLAAKRNNDRPGRTGSGGALMRCDNGTPAAAWSFTPWAASPALRPTPPPAPTASGETPHSPKRMRPGLRGTSRQRA